MSLNKWMRDGAVLLLVVIVCYPAAAMAAIHIKLKLNTETNPPTLEVSSNPARCSGGPLDCIQVPKDSWHNLFFELDNACEPEGPQYKLSSFQIAMKDKDWPTASNPLPDFAADDFDADPNSGYINLGAAGNEKSNDRIKFKDKNKGDKDKGPYSVFYEITAKQCNAAGEAKLDPVIKNGGGGNP